MQPTTDSTLGSNSRSHADSPAKQHFEETYFAMLTIDDILGVAGEKQETS